MVVVGLLEVVADGAVVEMVVGTAVVYEVAGSQASVACGDSVGPSADSVVETSQSVM